MELQPELKTLDEKQVATIRQHLGYVFAHGHLTPTQPSPAIGLPKRPESILERFGRTGGSPGGDLTIC